MWLPITACLHYVKMLFVNEDISDSQWTLNAEQRTENKIAHAWLSFIVSLCPVQSFNPPRKFQFFWLHHDRSPHCSVFCWLLWPFPPMINLSVFYTVLPRSSRFPGIVPSIIFVSSRSPVCAVFHVYWFWSRWSDPLKSFSVAVSDIFY